MLTLATHEIQKNTQHVASSLDINQKTFYATKICIVGLPSHKCDDLHSRDTKRLIPFPQALPGPQFYNITYNSGCSLPSTCGSQWFTQQFSWLALCRTTLGMHKCVAPRAKLPSSRERSRDLRTAKSLSGSQMDFLEGAFRHFLQGGYLRHLNSQSSSTSA